MEVVDRTAAVADHKVEVVDRIAVVVAHRAAGHRVVAGHKAGVVGRTAAVAVRSDHKTLWDLLTDVRTLGHSVSLVLSSIA